MKAPLTILLVEDDPTACQNISKIIDDFEDLLLVGITNNATRAIELIKDTLPDAIILDLELHIGSGNGLSVLQGLTQMGLPKKPYILITTNNSSVVTYESARQMGADFIMSKHQADYSEQNVIDFLRMMHQVIQKNRTKAEMARVTTESPDQYNKRIRKRIMTELNMVGISPKAVGYQYLVDAIQMIIKKPAQNLCCIIGEKYSKTESSVERAMQNAINRAWKTSDLNDLLVNYTAHIHSSKGVPTITEFVYYYANKIKNDY